MFYPIKLVETLKIILLFSVPRVPDIVENIEHSFIIVNTNITARISWRPPLSDAPLNGYRFIWGQVSFVAI